MRGVWRCSWGISLIDILLGFYGLGTGRRAKGGKIDKARQMPPERSNLGSVTALTPKATIETSDSACLYLSRIAHPNDPTEPCTAAPANRAVQLKLPCPLRKGIARWDVR